jgi:hypothetical protein
VFVGLQANNVADNIIKAGDGVGDRHCSHNYFIGELMTGHVTLGWHPGLQVVHGPHNQPSWQHCFCGGVLFVRLYLRTICRGTDHRYRISQWQ